MNRGIEAYAQCNEECEPHKIIIIGFSASGAFGADPVVIYYYEDKPWETLHVTSLACIRMQPIPVKVPR